MYPLTRKPLHMQKGMEAMIIEKPIGGSPSYRDMDKRYSDYQMPPDRCSGNTPLRRYADGRLDVPYVGFKVIEALDKLRELGDRKYLNQVERAVLSLIVPSMHFVDKGLARLLVKITPMEVEDIRIWVAAKLKATAHWNAGQGSGIAPGDFMDVNKSTAAEDEEKEAEKGISTKQTQESTGVKKPIEGLGIRQTSEKGWNLSLGDKETEKKAVKKSTEDQSDLAKSLLSLDNILKATKDGEDEDNRASG